MALRVPSTSKRAEGDDIDARCEEDGYWSKASFFSSGSRKLRFWKYIDYWSSYQGLVRYNNQFTVEGTVISADKRFITVKTLYGIYYKISHRHASPIFQSGDAYSQLCYKMFSVKYYSYDENGVYIKVDLLCPVEKRQKKP